MSDFVPKVHPLAREIDAEDPMELMANTVHGDPEVMLECMVQEFAWMGWSAVELMALFRSPMYPVLNQLMEHYGEEAIRERVEEILGRLGVFRFRETIEEEPNEEEELIQVSLNRLDGAREQS